MGLIAEEAPPEILSVDAKGVDLYKMISFLWVGVKVQERKIADLELRVANLEKLVGSSTPMMGESSQTIIAQGFEWVLEQFRQIGISIAHGVISAKEFIADKITAEKVVTNNLEMKDSVTGDVYCVRIANGEWEKIKGTCGEISGEISQTPNSNDQIPNTEPAPPAESPLPADATHQALQAGEDIQAGPPNSESVGGEQPPAEAPPPTESTAEQPTAEQPAAPPPSETAPSAESPISLETPEI